MQILCHVTLQAYRRCSEANKVFVANFTTCHQRYFRKLSTMVFFGSSYELEDFFFGYVQVW